MVVIKMDWSCLKMQIGLLGRRAFLRFKSSLGITMKRGIQFGLPSCYFFWVETTRLLGIGFFVVDVFVAVAFGSAGCVVFMSLVPGLFGTADTTFSGFSSAEIMEKVSRFTPSEIDTVFVVGL